MDPKYELVEVETSAGIETTASDSEQSRLGTDKQEATAASSPSSSLTTLATQPPTPPLPPQPPDLQHERPPHEAPVSSPPAPSSSPSSTARNGLTHNNNNNNNVASSDGGGGGGEIDSGRETRAEEEEGEGGGGEVEESVREEKLASETAKLINKDSLNTDINRFAHKDASNGGGDDGWDPESKLVGDQEVEIVIEQQHNDLIYKVSDCPPWYLTLFYAFQQSLTPVSGNLSIAILIADFVCGEDDEVLKTKLICTAMFMSGLSTFLQNTIGVRYVESYKIFFYN
ncbi:solute carrier family 23 member 2 [Octopus bimaculoides]|uniref:Uncharacterized protein n=1 Tax=Octopus bimaculoides TaxID=37653 RepID=A0A0L8GX95_OCTBM|nr:solute carrier family 23 member 2 [Octopus bimaculoides]|eukprot:XP_014777270.1 PREDICTED: solute carrier family 23 member 2-like [Octopus bimaculoides]